MKLHRNQHGKWHRTDGPAVTHPDGHKEWWFNGKRHRLDGPAVIYPDGSQEWWVNDVEVDQLTVMLLQHSAEVEV